MEVDLEPERRKMTGRSGGLGPVPGEGAPWQTALRRGNLKGGRPDTTETPTMLSEMFFLIISMSEAAQEEFTLEHKLNWAVTGGANNGCCRQLSATLQTGEWDACATDGSGDTGGTGSLTRHYWDCD